MANTFWFCRQHRHPEWECEADPGSDLESDCALPVGGQQLPTQEAHACMAQGNNTDGEHGGDDGGNDGGDCGYANDGGVLKNGDNDDGGGGADENGDDDGGVGVGD